MEKTRSFEQCLERLQEMEHYSSTDFQQLVDRVGMDVLLQRLNRQLDLYDRKFKERGGFDIRLQRMLVPGLLERGMKWSGILEKARRNARIPVVEYNEVVLPGLPEAFDGFRFLHLGDFHFDYMSDLQEILKASLQGIDVDACVLTGDFRGETTGPYQESLADLSRCREAMGDEVYSVLGNHDNIEFAIELDKIQIQPLINESVFVRRGSAAIRLCGVDDAYYYQTHDLEAVKDASWKGVSILLSHTPEICREASEKGFSVMWCGHTHGGQLCLPGGFPVITHLGRAPKRCVKGAWELNGLQGYTTRGVGCSSLDVRLNCPPEITIHTLRTGEAG